MRRRPAAEVDQPVGPAIPGWSPPPRPGHARIDGRRARPEPLDPDAHAAAPFEASRADGRIWTHPANGPFGSLAADRAWMLAAALGERPLLPAVIDRASGRPGGVASCLRIAPEAGSIGIGRLRRAPAPRRSRAVREALAPVMRTAFALGRRRCERDCDAVNAASRRRGRRLGLSFEGVFRRAGVATGRNRGVASRAAIDAEWTALDAAFAAWFDPANFDAAGRRRRLLSDLTRPLLHREG